MKFIIFVLLLAPSVYAITEKNYFDKEQKCFNTQDIKEIADHFKQLQPFASFKGQEICEGQGGLDHRWTNVVRSLLVLKRMSVKPVERNESDDFTRRVLHQKNWWGYFKERAHKFIFPAKCKKELTVAYVFRSKPGKVFLCDLFFSRKLARQIVSLVHEARHFDGFSHVSCTRGVRKDVEGACDKSIKDKGSYAVSVQVAVEMSRVSQFPKEERDSLEAFAIFSIYNRFNKVPMIDKEDHVYLSHQSGQVYKLTLKDSQAKSLDLWTTLESPARIYSNSRAITLYPIDLKEEAYRISHELEREADEDIGVYAKFYNTGLESQRESFITASYYGMTAMAQGSTLYNLCRKRKEDLDLTSIEFTPEKIKAFVSISPGPAVRKELYVMGKSGSLYSLNCIDKKFLELKKTDKKFPPNISESFTVDKVQYALNDQGSFVQLVEQEEGVFSQAEGLPLLKEMSWLSATSAPVSEYSVFERDSSSSSSSKD